MSTTPRPLPLALVLAAAGLALSCSGSSSPPPPVATTAPPVRTADELGPASSRDAGRSPSPGPAAPGATSPDATLPPGHPPIGGTDPHGGGPDPHGNVGGAGKTRSAGAISGTITLAAKLSASPSDVLYVIAKKGNSTLAVRRMEKPSFPLAFEISGSDAMMSGVAFEGPLDLVARVSRSGDAIPGKGDLEGTARNVKVPARGVSLTIDSVRQ